MIRRVSRDSYHENRLELRTIEQHHTEQEFKALNLRPHFPPDFIHSASILAIDYERALTLPFPTLTKK